MRSFQDFGKEFASVWEAGVLGVSVGEVVTALLVVLVFLGIRRLFYRFVVTALKTLTKKTKTTVGWGQSQVWNWRDMLFKNHTVKSQCQT